MCVLDTFFLTISFFGSELFVLVALAYVFYLDKHYGLRVSLATLTTILTTLLLKLTFRIPRPNPTHWKTTTQGYSMPSGHASISACFWGYTAKHFDSTLLRVFSPTIIILIGISRVYLGVHRWEDVFVGWALGIAVAFMFDAIYEKLSTLTNNMYVRLLIATTIITLLYAVLYVFWDMSEYDYQQALKVLSILAGLIITLISTPNTYFALPNPATTRHIVLRGTLTLLILLVPYTVAKLRTELAVPMFILMGAMLIVLIPQIIRRLGI